MHRHCCYFGWAFLACIAGCGCQQQPSTAVPPQLVPPNVAAEPPPPPPLKFDPAAPQWGDLSAVILYDGEPPPRRQLKVDKDQSVRREPLYDRSLVVDPGTKGIQYVCAWLLVNEKYPPAIHPDYEPLLKQPVVITTEQLNFEPYVSLVWRGQKVFTENKDPVGHSPSSVAVGGFLSPPNQAAYELSVAKRPQTVPQHVGCLIHPWMSAYIHVQDHPYMAVSDAEGELQIKNLPVGKHAFVFWHPLSGPITEIKRGDKVEKLPKGRLTVEIKPTNNYLGEITIKPVESN
jgi:hypothetical protein